MAEKLWRCPNCGKELPRFMGESNITCPDCGLILEAIVREGEKTKKLEKLEENK